MPPPQLLLDSLDMDKLPEANHRLLHIKATMDTFMFDGVKFASHYVEEELKRQLLKYDTQQVRAPKPTISVCLQWAWKGFRQAIQQSGRGGLAGC